MESGRTCRQVRRDNELSTAVTDPSEPPCGDEKVPTRRRRSSSGIRITKVMERLGIVKELKPKTALDNQGEGHGPGMPQRRPVFSATTQTPLRRG